MTSHFFNLLPGPVGRGRPVRAGLINEKRLVQKAFSRLVQKLPYFPIHCEKTSWSWVTLDRGGGGQLIVGRLLGKEVRRCPQP